MTSEQIVTPNQGDSISPYSGKPYVYKLSYPNGVVFYIGKGVNGRIHEHEREARRLETKQSNSYKCRVIRRIWESNGEVLKEIVSYFETEDEAHAYEVALIFFMRPYGRLTNITDGGEGATGRIPTEEHRYKQSEAAKGRNIPEEIRARISSTLTGRKLSEEHRAKMIQVSQTRKGQKRPEEIGARISKSLTGRRLSEEHRMKVIQLRKGAKTPDEVRAKQSAAQKGRIFSEEHKRKISEAKKGHEVSEEARRKLREANMGKKHSEEARRKMREAPRKYRSKAVEREEGLENNVGLLSPVVKSAYGSMVVDPADGREYDVYVDQFGDLSANRV